MSEPNRNEDALVRMLEEWGTHSRGRLPANLSKRVMERANVNRSEMFVSSKLVVVALLAFLSFSAWWLGRTPLVSNTSKNLVQTNSGNNQSMEPKESKVATDTAFEKFQATLDEIQAQMNMVQLELRVSRIRDEVQELQMKQIDGQRTIRRTIVKEKAIQEWMLAQRN